MIFNVYQCSSLKLLLVRRFASPSFGRAERGKSVYDILTNSLCIGPATEKRSADIVYRESRNSSRRRKRLGPNSAVLRVLITGHACWLQVPPTISDDLLIFFIQPWTCMFSDHLSQTISHKDGMAKSEDFQNLLEQRSSNDLPNSLCYPIFSLVKRNKNVFCLWQSKVFY